jgi:hypothetical protein
MVSRRQPWFVDGSWICVIVCRGVFGGYECCTTTCDSNSRVVVRQAMFTSDLQVKVQLASDNGRSGLFRGKTYRFAIHSISIERFVEG